MIENISKISGPQWNLHYLGSGFVYNNGYLSMLAATILPKSMFYHLHLQPSHHYSNLALYAPLYTYCNGHDDIMKKTDVAIKDKYISFYISILIPLLTIQY